MRCEDEKMFYRPPLLEEPCAQTLSGIVPAMRPGAATTKAKDVGAKLNMFRTCCRHTCVQLAKKRTSSSSQSTVRSFKECNDVVPFQNLASNEQRLSAHTTKDPVELVKLEFATHGLFETESTPLTVAIHMQIPAFEIVKANYSHFRTTAYKASCQALFRLPAFTLAGVSTMRSVQTMLFHSATS